MKILITGGCGFIGVNLVNYLLKKTNWQISVLDNLSVGKLDDLKTISKNSPKRVKFFKGDIRNKKDVEKAINNCDYVVHLAAQTGVIPSQKDPFKDAEINIFGTLNLLEIARKKGIKKFVLASSAAPLGEQKPPLDETKIPQPLSPYGASKLAGEGYCSAYAGSFGLKTVALRFSNVYGPWSYLKGSVVAKFIKQIKNNEAIIIYGDGEQTRDFVYVEDICQAIFLSLNKNFPNNFKLFQIGTGKETTVNKLFRLLEKELSERNYKVTKPNYEKERPGEIKKNYTDISKARKTLGYNPRTKLNQGIKKTLDWFLND